MKKIIKTLRKKWAEYLLEILVIVIGIISAFMLNSWHEGRKEGQLEQKMLVELCASLQNSIIYLDRAILRNDSAEKSCQLILDYFDSGLAYSDSLDRHFSNSLFWLHPSLTNNAYESLKSYGLHLISNDSIRNGLGDIYEWSFIERYSLRQDEYFFGTVAPLLTDWFESHDYFGKMKPLNYDELRRSAKYRHILKTMISNRRGQSRIFNVIRQDRINMSMMIKTELNEK